MLRESGVVSKSIASWSGTAPRRLLHVVNTAWEVFHDEFDGSMMVASSASCRPRTLAASFQNGPVKDLCRKRMYFIIVHVWHVLYVTWGPISNGLVIGNKSWIPLKEFIVHPTYL